jgi:hypothetical protein
MKFTRSQIVSILKERGWVRERSLWFFPTGIYGNTVKHLGVSLRDAASLEQLAASESLDARRKK